MTERITERTDEAAKVTLELTKDMIKKIVTLTNIRDRLIREKNNKVEMIERKFKKELYSIERDIYNFENAIKKVASAKDYRELRKEYLESLNPQKEKKESEGLENEDKM